MKVTWQQPKVGSLSQLTFINCKLRGKACGFLRACLLYAHWRRVKSLILTLGTLSNRRRPRRRGSQQVNLHSQEVKAGLNFSGPLLKVSITDASLRQLQVLAKNMIEFRPVASRFSH